MEGESKEWMGVCYDENVIEYNEYNSDYQDDSNVEIDVEVHSENFIEYTDSLECDKTQFEVIDTDRSDCHLDEGKVYSSSNIPDCELNSVIKIGHEVDEVTTSQQDLSQQKQDLLQKNLRTLRLKWFIHRENNRLKRKSMNCRICGTNSRFLNMQISVLRAEKEKLLEETNILRLTKEKLRNEVTSIQSNLIE